MVTELHMTILALQGVVEPFPSLTHAQSPSFTFSYFKISLVQYEYYLDS